MISMKRRKFIYLSVAVVSMFLMVGIGFIGKYIYNSAGSTHLQGPDINSDFQGEVKLREKETVEFKRATPEELLQLVNEERAKVGVAPLAIDQNVQIAAQLKADDMTIRNYRSHYLPEDPQTILTPEMQSYIDASCVVGSKNLFHHRDNTTVTAQRAVPSLMTSEAHRNAILNPSYTKTGFGVTDKVIVQHFCVAR